MPRRRSREFIDDCGTVPVSWFSPPRDSSTVHTRREIWIGPREFQIDVYWTADSVGDRGATINMWYDVFSKPYSATRQVVPDDWHRDERARESLDFNRHRMKLSLISRSIQGGARVWEFSCPRCGRPKRALYVCTKNVSLACRTCHNLRYRSQVRAAPRPKLPYAQRVMSQTIGEQHELIKQLLHEGSPTRPALRSLVAQLPPGAAQKGKPPT